MIDKLVEEIANDFLDFEGLEIPKDGIPIICRAMQAYHEAKLKEITDEDIVDYSRRIVKSSILCYSPLVETGIIIGAWAIRDGKIKHNG